MTSAFDASILETVKKSIGLYNISVYDEVIINDINMVFTRLNQLGVGPEEVYAIDDDSNTWDEFVTSNSMSLIIPYVCKKVQMLFDAPENTNLTNVINKQLEELEFCMIVEFDNDET